ncbi:MAG: asparaginase [Pseudomonadales bacterium]|jgi:L-asparaginase|nr:asparaginase [Pseudomonadales bacterium]
MSLRIFITGGTFDKEYDALTGNLCFRDTQVPKLLEHGRCQLDCPISTLMLKDSLDLHDDDRARIAQACRDAAETRLVITHGTDTMTTTAQVLAQAVPGKTIVLTGAMVPCAFGASDGPFNLGSALAFAQVLPPGIYIVMNGAVFPWHNVRKNRELGRFETIRS